LDVEVQIGTYVRPGDVLLRAQCDRVPHAELVSALQSAFQFDRDRSVRQDALFGIQQIVDIAVKALSPGVNDPTTAEQALDHLAGALTLLAARHLPDPCRVLEGGLVCTMRRPSFADFADAAFAQIRRAGRSDLHVSLYLLSVLEKMSAVITEPAYVAALRHQHAEVLAGFDGRGLTDTERAALDARRRAVSPLC